MDNRALGDPSTSAFQVHKYPFFLLNRLVSRYNAIIEPRLRAIDLDIPYWRVLMVLGERSPRGIRDISDSAVIPLSTMTRIVQRMANYELLKLWPSANDARVTLVSLSPLGKEKLAEARSITAPIYSQIIKGMSSKDFDNLLRLLGVILENLEEKAG